MDPADERRDRRTVVFVGRRRPAFEAARALGLEVLCVDEPAAGRRPPRGAAAFFPVSFARGRAAWSPLAERLASERKVAAVFALTERSVLPAAELRVRLGLRGDPPEVAERTTDKLRMKQRIQAAGLPCARFLDAAEGLGGEQLAGRLGLPLVIKARVSSGGRNNRLVRESAELPERLRAGWMAESFVDGVEMSVDSLVQGGRVVFANATEYFRVRWANVLPATLEDGLQQRLEDFNARSLAALGVRDGFTHLELFLTPRGPVFGEVAARPPGGHITELIELAYGFDPWSAWLRLGLGEELELPRQARRAAGAWLFHPGPGMVKAVAGVEAARASAGVERLALKLRPGQRVAERIGAGQEAGHLIVSGRDRDEVAERLRAAYGMVAIEMEPAPER